MQRGFTSVAFLVALIVAVLVGGGGYWYVTEQSGSASSETTTFQDLSQDSKKVSPEKTQVTNTEKGDTPPIISVSPTAGAVGTEVNIKVVKGRTFTAGEYSIHISKGCIEHVKPISPMLITFVMPTTVSACHDPVSQGTDTQTVVLEPGRTPSISVTEANGSGATNGVVFTVTPGGAGTMPEVTAQPISGSSPLSVTFRVKNLDENGDYAIDYGDEKGEQFVIKNGIPCIFGAGASVCKTEMMHPYTAGSGPNGGSTFRVRLLKYDEVKKSYTIQVPIKDVTISVTK